MVSRIFTFSILLIINANVWGVNLYIELVNKAKPDQETLEKAYKQIEEHKDIKVKNDLSVSPFHKQNLPKKTTKQPLCLTCHLPLPHRENVRSRSFLNMHSHYIACETCHLQPKNYAFDYRWLAYEGEQAGQIVSTRLAKIAKPGEPLPSIVPILGARIAPFFQDKPALIFKGGTETKEISKQWEDGTKEEKSFLKAALHTPLEKEGRECKECHRDEDEPGPLDLRSLGASDEQRKAISQNIIAQFFRRYKDGNEHKDEERIRMTDLLEGQKPK